MSWMSGKKQMRYAKDCKGIGMCESVFVYLGPIGASASKTVREVGSP